MSQDASQDVTRCLERLSEGRSSAVAELMPLVYDELRGLAAARLAAERPDHTLQPTALVHEAYLKLVGQRDANWKGRAHFFAVAAQAIRRILIDHARKHGALKRGAGHRVTLSGVEELPGEMEVDIVALDDALTRLSEKSERQARVVELRFFGGLSVEQAAQILDVSPGTVKGDWGSCSNSAAWTHDRGPACQAGRAVSGGRRDAGGQARRISRRRLR